MPNKFSRHFQDERQEVRAAALLFCAPSPPPPPDYAGAAVAQGAANKDSAIAGAQLSNPNIYSPTGSRTVSYANDPTTGNPIPTIRDSLSPEQQAIFDINQRGQKGLATVGADAVDRVGGILGQDVNFNRDIGTQAQGRDEVINAMMSRFDNDLGRRREGVEGDLVARGIPRGSEAWNREMDTLERARTDAYQQSIVGADERAMKDRQQEITEIMTQRQTPLNEISALRTGSQVAPLNFGGFQGSSVAPAPVFGASQATGNAQQGIYNAQTASSNSALGAAAGLGAAGISAYGAATAAAPVMAMF